jgi:hypothetical protein
MPAPAAARSVGRAPFHVGIATARLIAAWTAASTFEPFMSAATPWRLVDV